MGGQIEISTPVLYTLYIQCILHCMPFIWCPMYRVIIGSCEIIFASEGQLRAPNLILICAGRSALQTILFNDIKMDFSLKIE